MTEEEFLTCGEPEQLLYFFQEKGNDRKCRLFVAACCRRIWPYLPDQRSRQAVEVAERFADGLATADELSAARVAASDAYQDGSDAFYGYISDTSRPNNLAAYGAAIHVADTSELSLFGQAIRSAGHAAFHNVAPFTQADINAVLRPEKAAQLLLLHDIFGNPSRPVTILPEWRTDIVMAISRQMYESRDFSAMPILADALMDAGCADEAILTHCRGPGPHVRGCWCVDACLGKS